MKKVISIFLTAVIMLAALFCVGNVYAAAPTSDIARTQLGTSDTYYSYSVADGTLTIDGVGNTPDFSNRESSLPWYNWRGTIKKVVVASGVSSIGNYMLYQVRATEIILPETVRRLGKYSCAYTINVKEWTVPFGVTTIDDYAFSACTGMITVNLPESLQTIGSYAFNNCNALASVTLPSSLVSVGNYAFKNCNSLTSVDYASLSSAVKFGDYAFLTCAKLENLTMPANATLGTRAYGYKSTSVAYDDCAMNVYPESAGADYADANDIEYTTYTAIPTRCGIVFDTVFTADNMEDDITYSFTPDSDSEYCFYTYGNVDTKGELSLNNTTLAEADDVSDNNRNFSLSSKLSAGKTYTVSVSTVKATGTTHLMILPVGVKSVTAEGTVCMSLVNTTEKDDYRYFDMNDKKLLYITYTVQYNNGFEHKTLYSGFYDGQPMKYVDEQDAKHLTCGDNIAKMSIAGTTADFSVRVAHGYSESVVEPTEDEKGYTLYTCLICGDSYKTDYVDSPAVQITGKCVLSENILDEHSHNVPYHSAYITVDNRRYEIAKDGSWSVNTFTNKKVTLTFNNMYGKNCKVNVTVGNDSVDYGTVALDGYDINKDGIVNARDYAIYYRELRDELGNDYWQFADNFLLYY